MALDTRTQSSRILGSFDRKERKGISKTLGCGLLAALGYGGSFHGVAEFPAHETTMGHGEFAGCSERFFERGQSAGLYETDLKRLDGWLALEPCLQGAGGDFVGGDLGSKQQETDQNTHEVSSPMG